MIASLPKINTKLTGKGSVLSPKISIKSANPKKEVSLILIFIYIFPHHCLNLKFLKIPNFYFCYSNYLTFFINKNKQQLQMY